ncbi:MAG: diguanylate cyclase [Nitrospirae bacterium]|nr:diguanylate cyclase [Nitrospirota bacterium]
MRLEILTLKREIEEALYYRDPLTGAEGRIGMLTRLREVHTLVKRRVQNCSIAVLDLDSLKEINDTYGHPVGDVVLITVARYLMEHLRAYDKLFRYGGDEFLMCMQYADVKTSYEVVERLREELAAVAPVDDKGKPIPISVSIGIAPLDPDVTIEETIDRADKAMYAAKGAGRNSTRIWDPSMETVPGG